MRSGDEYGDPDYPGLRIRRTNAARVFFHRYRARDGALREIKLGEFGPMTLAEARKALGRLKLERERGVDPQLQKQQVRTEARRQREAEKLASYTVEKLVEDFVTEKLDAQKRGAEGARLLRRDLLPKLGDRAATALTRRELQDEVIRPMLKRAPRGGTYLLSRIRCAYAHAAEQGRIPDDFVFPTLGIKGAPQVRRKRAFTDAELSTFMRWLPHSPYSRTVRDALTLVLFTGCRSGEVVAALWRDIDLERAVWTIRETKNGEHQRCNLDHQACGIEIDLIHGLSTSKPSLDCDIHGRALPLGSTASSSLPTHGRESSRPKRRQSRTVLTLVQRSRRPISTSARRL